MFILSLCLQSSFVSPSQSSTCWQKALDPTKQLSIVALSIRPCAFLVQSLETWLHPPWVQQYRLVIWGAKFALSDVLRLRFLPPSPLPALPVLPPSLPPLPWSPLPIIPATAISRRRRRISCCTFGQLHLQQAALEVVLCLHSVSFCLRRPSCASLLASPFPNVVDWCTVAPPEYLRDGIPPAAWSVRDFLLVRPGHFWNVIWMPTRSYLHLFLHYILPMLSKNISYLELVWGLSLVAVALSMGYQQSWLVSVAALLGNTIGSVGLHKILSTSDSLCLISSDGNFM